MEYDIQGLVTLILKTTKETKTFREERDKPTHVYSNKF